MFFEPVVCGRLLQRHARRRILSIVPSLHDAVDISLTQRVDVPLSRLGVRPGQNNAACVVAVQIAYERRLMRGWHVLRYLCKREVGGAVKAFRWARQSHRASARVAGF